MCDATAGEKKTQMCDATFVPSPCVRCTEHIMVIIEYPQVNPIEAQHRLKPSFSGSNSMTNTTYAYLVSYVGISVIFSYLFPNATFFRTLEIRFIRMNVIVMTTIMGITIRSNRSDGDY